MLEIGTAALEQRCYLVFQYYQKISMEAITEVCMWYIKVILYIFDNQKQIKRCIRWDLILIVIYLT